MTHTEIEKLDAQASTMTLSLDISLYPRDVLYGAAYVFLDRAMCCWTATARVSSST